MQIVSVFLQLLQALMQITRGELKRKARKLTDLRAEISLSHWTYTFLI